MNSIRQFLNDVIRFYPLPADWLEPFWESPCGHSRGKMASNLMDSVVELTVNDVPGAAFMYSDIEKHSVLQLRRWLECRGMKRSGTKSLLLERYACVLYAYSS